MAGLGQTLAKQVLGRPLLWTAIAGGTAYAFKGREGIDYLSGKATEGIFNLVSSANSGTLSEAEDWLEATIGDNWFGRFMGKHGTEATILSVGAATTFLGPKAAKGWGIALLGVGVAMMFMNKELSKGFNHTTTDYTQANVSKYASNLTINPATFTSTQRADLSSDFVGVTETDLLMKASADVDITDQEKSYGVTDFALQGSGRFGGTVEQTDYEPDELDLEDEPSYET